MSDAFKNHWPLAADELEDLAVLTIDQMKDAIDRVVSWSAPGVVAEENVKLMAKAYLHMRIKQGSQT